MRYLSMALVVLISLGVFTSVAIAQESYYIRQNAAKYQQARTLASSLTSNAQSVQSEITSRRSQFNQGMASTNSRVRSRAKQVFRNYLGRLSRALLQAENAHGPAIYWGNKLARGLLQLQSRAAQGRGVAAQVQALRNTRTSLRNTRLGVGRESTAAGRRR